MQRYFYPFILSVVLTAFSGTLSATEAEQGRKHFWVDLYQAEVTDFGFVVDDLAEANLVYLGETHRIERHHEWQLKIIKALQAKGKKLIIGLEQIEEQFQEKLDTYNAGELSFDAFAEAINWNKRWKNYESYRDIVEFAQKHSIELVALNARAEIIRKVGRQGLEQLSAEERAELPEDINWDNDPVYRRLLNQIFLVHMAMTPETLTPIFQAQVARDENMAENMVLALAENEGAIGVIIAGSGHMNYGLGTAQRITKRMDVKKKRIVLFTVSGDLTLTEKERASAREITLNMEDLRFLPRPKADYLMVTETSAASE